MTFDELLARLQGVTRRKDDATAKCPAHDDGRASLSVTQGEEGKLLLRCHAGCDVASVVQALGLAMRDLFPAKPVKGKRGTIVATYDYTDEENKLLFQVVRFDPKDFRQRRRDPAKPDGWSWSLGDTRRVLYRLPAVVEAAKRGRVVFVVEGEKDADALVAREACATTSPQGAGKWRPEYAESLRGASRVVVVADKDAPGRKHAAQVAESVRKVVPDVRVVEVPGAGKDAADFLAGGGQVDDLLALAEAAPVGAPEGEDKAGVPGRSALAVERAARALGKALSAFDDPRSPCHATGAALPVMWSWIGSAGAALGIPTGILADAASAGRGWGAAAMQAVEAAARAGGDAAQPDAPPEVSRAAWRTALERARLALVALGDATRDAAAGEGGGPPPTIVHSVDLMGMTDDAEAALAGSRYEVFQRGGRLVRVLLDHKGRLVLDDMPEARMRELLSRVAAWVKEREVKGEPVQVPALPHADAVKALMSRGQWSFPVVETVVDAPVVRPDGSLHTTPGPDPETRVLYRPRGAFPAAIARPTRDQARAALDELAALFCDFRFVAACDRSAALALMLTLVGRRAIPGCVPMFAIRASTPGTGKTLVADVAAAVAYGKQRLERETLANEEEERKRLVTVGMAGQPVLLIDNVTRPLGNPVLDAAITGGEFAGRLLGMNVNITVPVPVFVATGNNMRIKSDLMRRLVVCDLSVDVERPDRRTGFRLALPGHALEHRPRLYMAAVTVLRWFLLERPRVKALPFGSFQEWSDIVRAALVALGEADPLGGQARLEEAGDPQLEAARLAVAGWHAALRGRHVSMRDVVDEAKKPTRGDLRAALAGLDLRIDPESLDARKVAIELGRYENRILDGLRLERVPGKSERGALWRVVEVAEPAADPPIEVAEPIAATEPAAPAPISEAEPETAAPIAATEPADVAEAADDEEETAADPGWAFDPDAEVAYGDTA